MLVYSIGNGIDGIPPAAFGEAFRTWKPPGVNKPADNNFGWGPLASVLIHKIEKFSRDAFLDATLIASQNVKTLKWNKIVRPAFERARKHIGFIMPITLRYTLWLVLTFSDIDITQTHVHYCHTRTFHFERTGNATSSTAIYAVGQAQCMDHMQGFKKVYVSA